MQVVEPQKVPGQVLRSLWWSNTEKRQDEAVAGCEEDERLILDGREGDYE